MIKINLNKTQSSVVYPDTKSTGLAASGSTIITKLKGILDDQETVITPAIVAKMIINCVLIAGFPLGLKIYEIQNIGKLNAEKKKMEVTLTEEKSRLSQLEKELNSYSHLKDKSKEFIKKKEFLKQLAEKRLVVPRIIDSVQNKTPKTVWLKSLDIDVTGDKNQIKISGESFSESHVNFFASSLHEILDKNSIIVNTKDIKKGKSVVKVGFDLQGFM